MSAWVSVAPAIGSGSLDGFAIGALMSGACALAITAPRRARRPLAAGGGAQAGGRNGWLCEHVMAAEAIGFGLAAEAAVAVDGAAGGAVTAEVARTEETVEMVETARTGMAWAGLAGAGPAGEAFGAGAERLARPEELGTQGKGRPAGGREGKSAGGYRSRHRRGDPISVCAPRDGLSPGRVSLQSAFPLVGLSGGRWWRNAYPDVVFPDAELTGSTLAGRRRPEARRLPRHAAPSVGLGSRITGIGSRMTGLFAARALASGAHG
jgi:hypothetical protein